MQKISNFIATFRIININLDSKNDKYEIQLQALIPIRFNINWLRKQPNGAS